MKVKLFRPIYCPDGSFRAGEEPNLTDAIAKGLIDGGYAKSLEKPAETIVVEVIPPSEKVKEIQKKMPHVKPPKKGR